MKARHAPNSNIISLAKSRPLMAYPAIAHIEGYWDALRGGAMVPMRSDVDPRGLADVLEYSFILERIAPGVGRFRLAGMHLNDLMGMEVRGMPATAMFAPEARRELSEVVEKVCMQPAIAELSLKAEGGFGRSRLEAKMLLAPLKSDFGDVNRILGCLQSLGRIGRQPRRFVIADCDLRPLDQSGKSHPTSRPAPARAGFEEPAAKFVAMGEEAAGEEAARPVSAPLKLVVDNG